MTAVAWRIGSLLLSISVLGCNSMITSQQRVADLIKVHGYPTFVVHKVSVNDHTLVLRGARKCSNDQNYSALTQEFIGKELVYIKTEQDAALLTIALPTS